MTAKALLALIEKTPACAKHWRRVFEAPKGKEPKEGKEPVDRHGTRLSGWDRWASVRAMRSSWNVKKGRAGRLHPDAAFEIAQMIRPALDGDDAAQVTPDLVAEAHELFRARSRRTKR